MGFKHLFPTVFYSNRLSTSGLSKLTSDLLKECYTFSDIDEAGRKWSKVNYNQGYTSYGSILDLPDRSPTFELFRKKVDLHIRKFVKYLEMDLKGRKLKMGECWINVMGPHCHHSFHIHPLSVFSGTFYVQIPDNSGCFKIEDPRMDCFMGSPPRSLDCKESNLRHIQVKPRVGDVILFESWLRHEVPANRSKRERISISFNYYWD